MAKPVGRPSIYTPELAAEICRRLAEGDGLLKICKGADMPARSIVLVWQHEREDFRAAIARARVAQGHAMAERAQAIIDDCVAGNIAADVARVALYGLQWQASKLHPAAYSDRLELAGDKEAPLSITFRRLDK
jgi:predicted nuclease with TOPRIM domain